MRLGSLAFVVLLVASLLVGAVPVVSMPGDSPGTERLFTDPVQTKALAVGVTEGGELVGASADLSVTVSSEGSGHVFIDTRPLAGTDMQGSARMAAHVAASVTGFSMEAHDFFFTVRSQTPIISGPSAGSVMAKATVVALMNANLDEGQEPWTISQSVMGTGTIAPDGSVGPVGGILVKAEEARDQGAELFTFPAGQSMFQEGAMIPGQDPGPAVDVPTYCEEELGIECRGVGSLEELVELSSGYRFDRPDVGEQPTTALYNDTLAPLSLDLLDDAKAYQEVWASLNQTDLREGPHQQVQTSLEFAHDSYQEAVTLREETRYYSSASRAFSASIHGTHAGLLLSYYQQGRSLDYVEDRIEHVEGIVDEAREQATGLPVEDMHALYTVGAAQERVSDAENRIENARANLGHENVNEVLFDTAWAVERSKTVHWWLHLGEEFGAGPVLPVDVEIVAADFMDLAEELLAYASQVLEQSPPRAASTLSDARADADRGFHAAALTQAAQAQVQAAISVELRAGEPSQEKLETSQRKAVEAIETARSLGVEPVLAVAMFEFGSIQDETVVELEHYRTAQVMAGISNVLAGEGAERSSTFIGPWEPAFSFPRTGLESDARGWALGWYIIGMFTTLAGVTFVAALREGGDEGF